MRSPDPELESDNPHSNNLKHNDPPYKFKCFEYYDTGTIRDPYESPLSQWIVWHRIHLSRLGLWRLLFDVGLLWKHK